jgi:RimJ/RimL family protein N-acetyltransferase
LAAKAIYFDVREKSSTLQPTSFQINFFQMIKMSDSKPLEPEGALVSTIPALSPSPTILRSSLPSTHVQSVTLVPVSESHTKALYPVLGDPENAHIYRYLPGGPFSDFKSFAEYQKFLIHGGMFFPFTIFKHDPEHRSSQTHLTEGDEGRGSPIGIITLMNIVPKNRTIEIGHVLFSPLLQRTTAATEAIYLLMKYCFEDLNYRRVEWKANNFNEPSKRAAVRLGFVLEGLFRKHMIVKGRNRDTAFFSVTDDEWMSGVRQALEGWLEKENFDGEGRQLRKLEDIRASLAQNETEEQ